MKTIRNIFILLVVITGFGSSIYFLLTGNPLHAIYGILFCLLIELDEIRAKKHINFC